MVTTETKACFPHIGPEREREKQAAEEMGFTFCTAGWERERDGEGSGGFAGFRKNLGEILERETAVRVLTHKWNMSERRSQKLTVVYTHIWQQHRVSNNTASAQFTQTLI